MKLTVDLIESLSGIYLSPKYDSPQPTPDFHRECWARYCSNHPACATAAPRNHAKAQSLDSKVLTPTGWEYIRNLRVGDLVIGSKGTPITITHLHPVSEQPLYRVHTKDGRSTLCNEEHLWSVYIPQNTGNKLVTKTLKDIRKIAFAERNSGYTESKVFLPLSEPVEWYSHEEDLIVKPYMLGVWLGDGHTADGRITSADPEIFNWFDCEVVKQSGAYLYKAIGLKERLKLLGVLKNKYVPSLFLISSPVDRLALLQGLMDTDGTLHQDGKIAYFCNTNENLIEAVIHIVRSLGGIAFVSTTKIAKGATKTSWRVSVKLPKNLNPFRLTRKAIGWKGSAIKLAITNITFEGYIPARCITVSAKDGLYITDDFLLTHNSTSLTHDYSLACALFRSESYIIIVGSSEEMAIEHLGDIASELSSNEDIIRDFKIKGFLTQQKTDIIVECEDGYQFRFIARGAEQKIRGRKWRGCRPGLIIGDDLEDDEQVENRDRRRKFRRWFFRACKQSLRDGGKIRVHGTILHEDSLLNHLIKNKSWNSKVYKAHKSFDDFTEALWPEKFPEHRLRAIRQEFINEGDSAGYSQEYLNDPFDYEDAYLRKDDFIPMSLDDYDVSKIVCVGVDFAVSKEQSANRTSFSVGGKDLNNIIHYIDQRLDRLDAMEIIEEFFIIQQAWSPDVFFVEDGVIWKSIRPMLESEMQKRDTWLSIKAILPVKDKAVRGRSLQKRMRARGCRFDKNASWYPAFEAELLRFTGTSDALEDDQIDSAAILSRGFEDYKPVEEEDFYTDEELEFRDMSGILKGDTGRSAVTGY